MDFADGPAWDRELDEVKLFTNVKMWENIGLYAKPGFEETERKTEDGFERVYFAKKLR